MSSIALYDIDFHHSSRFTPNLELMKVFNYYYSKNNIVVFVEPKENLQRFNQIFFFKENEKTKIPKSLDLLGENKQIYGYGFWRKFTELKPEIAATPPSFLPYDINIENIKNQKAYRHIKNNSIVRIENNDFTGFHSEKNTIYVADKNFLYQPSAMDFAKEYRRKYNIKFLHSLKANEEKKVIDFYSLASRSGRNILINFLPSKEFFQNYYYERIAFYLTPLELENNYSEFIKRIFLMTMWAKKENRQITFLRYNPSQIDIKKEPLKKLIPMIYKWSISKEENFYDFIMGTPYKKTLIDLITDRTELRLLFKTNPKNIDINNLTFLK